MPKRKHLPDHWELISEAVSQMEDNYASLIVIANQVNRQQGVGEALKQEIPQEQDITPDFIGLDKNSLTLESLTGAINTSRQWHLQTLNAITKSLNQLEGAAQEVDQAYVNTLNSAKNRISKHLKEIDILQSRQEVLHNAQLQAQQQRKDCIAQWHKQREQNQAGKSDVKPYVRNMTNKIVKTEKDLTTCQDYERGRTYAMTVLTTQLACGAISANKLPNKQAFEKALKQMYRDKSYRLGGMHFFEEFSNDLVQSKTPKP